MYNVNVMSFREKENAIVINNRVERTQELLTQRNEINDNCY